MLDGVVNPSNYERDKNLSNLYLTLFTLHVAVAVLAVLAVVTSLEKNLSISFFILTSCIIRYIIYNHK